MNIAAHFNVDRQALKKLCSMGVLLFSLVFNYILFRDIKDALIINAPGSGAESIAVLKLYGSLIFAFVGIPLYFKLINRFDRHKIFKGVMMTYMVFLLVLGALIYPFYDLFHPSLEKVQALQQEYPRWKWFIAAMGSWGYSLFYLLAMGWSGIVIGQLYWQFANNITPLREALTFYPAFALISNGAVMVAGILVFYAYTPAITYALPVFPILFLLMAGICGFILWWHRRMDHHGLLESNTPPKEKPTLPFFKSLAYILRSSSMWHITLLIIFSQMALFICTSIAKHYFLRITPAGASMPLPWAGTQAAFSLVLSLASLYILPRFGWMVGAMVSPLVTVMMGALLVLIGLLANPEASSGVMPFSIYVCIFYASVIPAFFFPTKTMIYIPLNQELKSKGMLIVENLGIKLASVLGASLLVFNFDSPSIFFGLSNFSHLGGMLIIIAFLWLILVKKSNPSQ